MVVGKWTVDRRILLACLAGAAFLLAVNLVSSALVNVDRGKMGANQIVSPWDKSAVPPVLKPSIVVTNPVPVAPVAEPEPRHKRHTVASGRHLVQRTASASD